MSSVRTSSSAEWIYITYQQDSVRVVIVTYFTSNLTLEFDTRVGIHEAQILENLYTLLIIRKKLKILIGHELSQLRDVFFDKPFVVARCELVY